MGFIVLLVLIVANSVASRHLVLIDRSGSMRVYYETGVVRDLAAKIEQVCQEEMPTQIALFSSDVIEISDLQDPKFDYETGASFTLLDRAVDFAIEHDYDLCWLLTDNIQDEPGSPQAGNTEVFYQRLRGEKVNKVVIFPVIQPPGRCGLVLYGVLFSEDDSIFERELEKVQSVLRPKYQTEPLRMKPLDKNTVEMIVLAGKIANSGKKLSAGKILIDSLEVRFKSKFDHLQIVDALIREPRIVPEFETGSILYPEKMEWTITPRTITTLDPAEETQQIYKVCLDLGKLRIKGDFGSLWAAAFGKPQERFTVNLAFCIEVQQGNFRFKESFLRKYNANTLSEAQSTGRVYALTNLPVLLGAGTNPILTETRLVYDFARPWWPAFLFIIIFSIVFLGAAVTFVKLIARPKAKWTVRAETLDGAPLTCELRTDGTIILDRQEIGKIQRNRFVPSEILSLVTDDGEEGKGTIRLKDGVGYRFRQNKAEFLLIFYKERLGEEP